MSERVSSIIILCEDDAHSALVRSYMKECGLNAESPCCKPIVASREVHGGNVKWVLNEFPRQFAAVQARHKAHANTLLIVVADADDQSVSDRINQLRRSSPHTNSDPVVLLIPKRNVETWIRLALNPKELLTESDDYKPRRLDKSQLRAAAKQIHTWVHSEPKPDFITVPSMAESLSQWRRIG